MDNPEIPQFIPEREGEPRMHDEPVKDKQDEKPKAEAQKKDKELGDALASLLHELAELSKRKAALGPFIGQLIAFAKKSSTYSEVIKNQNILQLIEIAASAARHAKEIKQAIKNVQESGLKGEAVDELIALLQRKLELAEQKLEAQHQQKKDAPRRDEKQTEKPNEDKEAPHKDEEKNSDSDEKDESQENEEIEIPTFLRRSRMKEAKAEPPKPRRKRKEETAKKPSFAPKAPQVLVAEENARRDMRKESLQKIGMQEVRADEVLEAIKGLLKRDEINVYARAAFAAEENIEQRLTDLKNQESDETPGEKTKKEALQKLYDVIEKNFEALGEKDIVDAKWLDEHKDELVQSIITTLHQGLEGEVAKRMFDAQKKTIKRALRRGVVLSTVSIATTFLTGGVTHALKWADAWRAGITAGASVLTTTGASRFSRKKGQEKAQRAAHDQRAKITAEVVDKEKGCRLIKHESEFAAILASTVRGVSRQNINERAQELITSGNITDAALAKGYIVKECEQSLRERIASQYVTAEKGNLALLCAAVKPDGVSDEEWQKYESDRQEIEKQMEAERDLLTVYIDNEAYESNLVRRGAEVQEENAIIKALQAYGKAGSLDFALDQKGMEKAGRILGVFGTKTGFAVLTAVLHGSKIARGSLGLAGGLSSGAASLDRFESYEKGKAIEKLHKKIADAEENLADVFRLDVSEREQRMRAFQPTISYDKDGKPLVRYKEGLTKEELTALADSEQKEYQNQRQAQEKKLRELSNLAFDVEAKLKAGLFDVSPLYKERAINFVDSMRLIGTAREIEEKLKHREEKLESSVQKQYKKLGSSWKKAGWVGLMGLVGATAAVAPGIAMAEVFGTGVHADAALHKGEEDINLSLEKALDEKDTAALPHEISKPDGGHSGWKTFPPLDTPDTPVKTTTPFPSELPSDTAAPKSGEAVEAVSSGEGAKKTPLPAPEGDSQAETHRAAVAPERLEELLAQSESGYGKQYEREVFRAFQNGVEVPKADGVQTITGRSAVEQLHIVHPGDKVIVKSGDTVIGEQTLGEWDTRTGRGSVWGGVKEILIKKYGEHPTEVPDDITVRVERGEGVPLVNHDDLVSAEIVASAEGGSLPKDDGGDVVEPITKTETQLPVEQPLIPPKTPAAVDVTDHETSSAIDFEKIQPADILPQSHINERILDGALHKLMAEGNAKPEVLKFDGFLYDQLDDGKASGYHFLEEGADGK